MIQRLTVVALLLAMVGLAHAAEPGPVKKIEGAKPRNVIFILTDDHRYDVMGFMGHYVETPNLDSIARNGVHFANAFVTTSLCSPSRASILSGMYVHNHRVVDNNDMMSPEVVTFPQYLQKLGYQTGFFGKWHMGGHSDDPRPGFDRWVSFRGQGHYYPPDNKKWSLNVDGESVPQKGYITDELTDYALDWLNNVDKDKPFFAYVSHKAVHGMFYPAERHKGRYKDKKFDAPETMANTAENNAGKPMWLQNQRNSWHGVDFAYHDAGTPIQQLYRDYCESLLAVDDSVGRLLNWLKEHNLHEDTLVIYMGDNGFQWGEHGLIDKRTGYEASIRVPMIAQCPDLFPAGTVVRSVVANIDIAPTILEAAGMQTPEAMNGRSFLQLASGNLDPKNWRKNLLYEYYWEWNFPHTPTVFALRGDKYKLITYHGIWDTDELYDIQSDPQEKHNLIRDPRYKKVVRDMRRELWNTLKDTGGTEIPFGFKRSHGQNLRHVGGSKAADFPEHVIIHEEAARNSDRKKKK